MEMGQQGVISITPSIAPTSPDNKKIRRCAITP